MGLVFLALWRELRLHPWQLALTLFSISAGVAVVVGVDVANSSAMGEFERANSLVDGVATHRIVGGEQGIDQDIFRIVKVEAGIRDAAPVIDKVVSVEGQQRQFQLLGIDPLSDFRIRSATGGFDANTFGGDPVSWPITSSDKTIVEQSETITLAVGGRSQSFRIVNSIDADTAGGIGTNLLVTDIAWAQSFLHMPGKISHVALRLGSPREIDRLEALLPQSVRLIDIGLFNSAKEEMTRAFRTNLVALSLLALVIAMFLIYSSVSFQVIRRTETLARLRSVGVTGRELGAALMVEIVLLAVIGTAIGIALGLLLASVLSGLVTGTINALYFSLTQAGTQITGFTLVKGAGVGIAATIIAAGIPVVLASRTAVRQMLLRSRQEQRLIRFSNWSTAIALVLFSVGLFCLWLPTRQLIVPFAGLFLVILSLAALAPRVIELVSQFATRMQVRERFLFLKMALVNVGAQLSRTAVAVAALTVAVSATLGVGLMIDSFRVSVEQWMEGYLRADIYLTSEAVSSPILSPVFVNELSGLEGVRDISLGTRRTVVGADGPLILFALSTTDEGFAGFQVETKDPTLWSRFQDEEAVLITEPLSRRLQLQVGDPVSVATDKGEKDFQVAGIYRDYSSDRGLVTMSWRTYQQYFNSDRVASAALYLESGVDPEVVMAAVRQLDNQPESLFMRSDQGLREASLQVFDQTFLITEVLRWLALTVAVIGIVCSLMALQLERQREYAILRAIGFTRFQLVRQLLTETAVTGLIAGILAIPMGILLALMLIHVINVRSFGWSMETVIDGGLVLSAVLLAVVAGVVGGAYPAWRQRRVSINEGLRNE